MAGFFLPERISGLEVVVSIRALVEGAASVVEGASLEGGRELDSNAGPEVLASPGDGRKRSSINTAALRISR